MVISGNISAVSKQVLGNIKSNSNIDGSVDKAENIYIKEVEFSNHYSFPNVGKENIIYVAKDENACYIFDTTQNIYHCIGRDYNEISAINCQLKEE